MAYCRFSSDDYQCDVYVFASVTGAWETMVATSRYVGLVEQLPPPAPDDDLTAQMERFTFVSNLAASCDREPIGLGSDGQTFYDPTPGACADRLETLRKQGYLVPQYAIDGLRAEQAKDDLDG